MLNSNLRAKLLWTNSNPTSSFASQSISIDLSKYNYAIVEFVANINNTNIISRILVSKNEYARYGAGSVETDATTRTRRVSITDSTVTFSNGYSSDGSSIVSVNNNVCIPVKIYGVNMSL